MLKEKGTSIVVDAFVVVEASIIVEASIVVGASIIVEAFVENIKEYSRHRGNTTRCPFPRFLR